MYPMICPATTCVADGEAGREAEFFGRLPVVGAGCVVVLVEVVVTPAVAVGIVMASPLMPIDSVCRRVISPSTAARIGCIRTPMMSVPS